MKFAAAGDTSPIIPLKAVAATWPFEPVSVIAAAPERFIVRRPFPEDGLVRFQVGFTKLPKYPLIDAPLMTPRLPPPVVAKSK